MPSAPRASIWPYYARRCRRPPKLLKVGYAPVPTDVDTAELAAWTHVARVLLNLHETITRNEH